MTTLTGAGEVLKAGKHVCKVQYKLQQRETTSGHVGISGEVVVDEGERRAVNVLNTMQSGELLTLRLDDNRSLEVFFNPRDAINGVWRVVVGPGSAALA